MNINIGVRLCVLFPILFNIWFFDVASNRFACRQIHYILSFIRNHSVRDTCHFPFAMIIGIAIEVCIDKTF